MLLWASTTASAQDEPDAWTPPPVDASPPDLYDPVTFNPGPDGAPPPETFSPPDENGTPPSLPRQPRPRSPPPHPRSPPVPPSPPPAPPAPPPPAPLPIRLVQNTSSGGIVQLQDPSSGEWGLVCVDATALNPQLLVHPGSDLGAVAQLACGQLGLPTRNARATLPFLAGLVAADWAPLPAKAAFSDAFARCRNALDVGSLTGCDGLVVVEGLADSCGAVGEELELGVRLVPLIVECIGELPPSPPPPPPPNTPPPPPITLPARLVDPVTGAEGGDRGRLELLQGDTWGTVCMWMQGVIEIGVAQYACRYLGLPWSRPSLRLVPADLQSRAERSQRKQQPSVILEATHCTLTEPGPGDVEGATLALTCEDLTSRALTPWLFDASWGLPESQRVGWLTVAQYCSGSADGHAWDAYVVCADAPPPAPPSPPAAPLPVRNSVRLNWTEHFPGVYEVRFGVSAEPSVPSPSPSLSPSPGNGNGSGNGTAGGSSNSSTNSSSSSAGPASDRTVWGIACAPPPRVASITKGPTAATLCAQITGGRKLYGYAVPAPPTAPVPFLAAPEVRRDAPLVLEHLDCSPPDWGRHHRKRPAPLPDIRNCEARVADPLPSRQGPHCWSSGWGANLLACTDAPVHASEDGDFILSLRLTGGATPRSGRLEVVMRHEVSYGWGAVCDDGTFTREHAQAVCRDLGLPWAGAGLLPAAAAEPPPPGLHVLLSELACDPQVPPGDLRFARDCSRSRPYAYSGCSAVTQAVVVACEDAPSGPAYGGYGGYGQYPPSVPAYGGAPPAVGPTRRMRRLV
ncbi:hypothetical protein HYH03_000772 [Edaphochlamys debaryana]|uniref:SRCR domain-containing protein n=1 Tax=Edaphochlamys debaryana TaxID=47281 RepID=A0A835YGU2_9CHLO|nr:hypothetical protein HYH03_000772 [Edaphochlamys debaryana]|eukprot:KAG2500948.1 hypothetical protein HYH03_000772 [Edaphochlamys debaryana]